METAHRTAHLSPVSDRPDGTERPVWGHRVSTLHWTGAAAGVLITPLCLERWPGVGFGMYLALGWLAVVATP
jgi:predicted membrane channel-forming protein YqfA (hemolysin III family)